MPDSRRILLGVTASIAIHRALDITSELRKAGHRVTVIMTPNSQRMITPLTFQAMSLETVYHDPWAVESSRDHDHIRMAQEGELLLVAPATASTIGKLAHGILDNLVATTAFAFDGPRLLAPAMNWRMWAKSIVQENLRRLEADGWQIIPPEEGDLACGEKGPGRLARVDTILDRVRSALPASPPS